MSIKNTLESFVLIPKTTTFIRAFFMLVILFSAKSYAGCAREDVNFYLKQGFNHEQIVKLCSPQNTIPQQQSIPSTQHSQQTPSSLQHKQAAHKHSSPSEHTHAAPAHHTHGTPPSQHAASGIYGNPDAVFLATAVEAYDVEVTDRAIMFTRKDCFDYGQEDWNQFQDRACPNVKYTINRGGLKIIERDNGIFGIGATALYVSGDIYAEILDLDQFNPKHQETIREMIQRNTKKLKVNVRSGMPQSKVEAILLRIAG